MIQIYLFISNSNRANLLETMNEELRKVLPSFGQIQDKIFLFHSTTKRKYIKISYLHCILKMFQSKDNSSQSFSESTYIKIYPGSIINIASTKVCMSIGILYRTCWYLVNFLRKQLYFPFLNYCLYWANITRASTNKSKLQSLYRYQKCAGRIMNFKDNFTFAKPLLEQINTRTVYEIKIFQTLCFMYLCKNG